MPKISSKDVYTLLREDLSSSFKASSFKRMKSTTLGWMRPEGDLHLCSWFQCDKWGWSDTEGSSFTMDFQLASHTFPGDMVGQFQRSFRFPQLLSPEDLEIVRHRNNEILSTIWANSSGQQLLCNRPTEAPYPSNKDVWLHYFSFDDIQFWSSFLKVHLPGMIASFLKQCPKS